MWVVASQPNGLHIHLHLRKIEFYEITKDLKIMNEQEKHFVRFLFHITKYHKLNRKLARKIIEKRNIISE